MEDRYEPLFPPPPTSGNEYDDNWLQLSCLMPHTESIHFPTTTCQPYINISRLTIGRQRSIKPRYSLSLQYLTREAFAPEKQKRLSGVLVHHFVLPFLATGFKSATYVERQEELCEIAAHNFPILHLNHINVRNEDGVAYLQTMSPVDCIFLDPARRNEHGGKTVSIADCEPNVAELEDLLLSKASRIMIKLSPMLDLSLALKELKHTQEVHILSVNNECKELLILLGQTSPAEITIHCVNLFTKGTQEEQHFVFTREQEQRSQCTYTDSLGDYLYEPNASLLKAGAFRSIAAAYPVRKLHPNSHLYTSDTFIENFPGRIFRIVNQCSFNKKEVKENLADLKKANVTVRNFPATVAELRKRLHLTEGGDTYLFASTLNNGQKVIIRCEKV